MSTATDHSFKVHPSAISVKIGEIGVTAILDNNYEFNAINERILKKIREKDNDSKITDTVENIELDITIDGHLVSVAFRVSKNLIHAGMVLGGEFFHSVKAHIHPQRGLLKWSYQDKCVITNMVKINDDADLFDEMMKELLDALKLPEDEKPAKPVEDSCKNETKKKKPTKPSEEDFVKVFITKEDWWDLNSGECLFYYGVYSSQKKILFCTGELLDCKIKTPLGYFMEALNHAFDEARKHEVKNLHMILDDRRVVDIMTRFQKRYEKYGETDVTEFPIALYRPDDFVNYSVACGAIPGFEWIKFDFVSSEDQSYKEMVHLRALLEKYAKRNPM